MNDIELIQSLIRMADELPDRDRDKLDALRRRAEMIIRRLFGESSKYLNDLARVSFTPRVFPSSGEYEDQCWRTGTSEILNLFNTMSEELKLFGGAKKPRTARKTSERPLNRVFVVHGHDDGMKQAVARTLERIGLDPIILHEKPSQGRTIIEKFTDYSDVSFAVVLLSPDDVGYPRDQTAEVAKLRARQNVVFELGFFIGKLGRKCVLVLYQEEPDFEMPSDYSGVLYTAYDTSGRWKFDLVKELKASGYDVDANRLI